MTGPEFQAARAALGLTQGSLASDLGCSRRTVQYWESDEHPIPETVSRVIRLALIDPTILVRIAAA